MKNQSSPERKNRIISPRRRTTSNRGMALYLVLGVVFIMALLMPVYFSFSRQLSFSSFTQLNEERLALIAKIIHDSTFTYMVSASRDPGHKIARFLLDSVKMNISNDIKDLEKEPELGKILAESISRKVTIDDCQYTISAKVFDQCQKNAEDIRYYPGEGLASLEITVQASLYKSRSLLASCRYVRQYDYKSVCMVAEKDDQYSMGFPLKYALFVRDAYNESVEEANRGLPYYSDTAGLLELSSNEGDIYLFGLPGQKMTSRGNYLNAQPKVYNFKNTLLTNVNSAKGSSGFRPFRNCSLYAVRFNGADSFLKSGIYDEKTGELHLPGLVDIQNAHLVLAKPKNGGKIKVFGKGGLLVPEGITIECGIELNNKEQDMCVIYSRKNVINLKTSDTIEAALLAFNDNSTLNGGIKNSAPFKIFGCLGVDRLFWYSKPFKCEIEYDKRFKATTADKEIFLVSISPWVRFENKLFSKQDLLK